MNGQDFAHQFRFRKKGKKKKIEQEINLKSTHWLAGEIIICNLK